MVLLLSLFAAVGVHAQLLPPRLTALTRESPATISPGGTVQFRFSVTPGTVAAQSIGLALVARDKSEYRVIHAEASSSGVASLAVDSNWVNGSYDLAFVEVVDNWSRAVRYLPDGTVSSGSFANAESGHAFDFTALGVVVAGASLQAAIPTITSVEMLLPTTVSPGQSVRFRLAGTNNRFPVARIVLGFTPSGGSTLSATIDTTTITSEFVVPITAEMVNGRYSLTSIRISNQAGDGFVSNPSTGTPQIVVASVGGVNYSTVGDIAVGALSFTVTGASTFAAFPRLTSWSRVGQGEVAPGDTLRFSYDTTPAATSSPVQRMEAVITGPYGASFTYTSELASGEISLPVSSSWITGPYTFTRISLTDSAGRNTIYQPAGSIPFVPPGVRDSIPVPAEQFRFDVRATSIAPFFILQPKAETTLTAFDAVQLTVLGFGPGPATYQWYRGEPGDTSQPVAADRPVSSSQAGSQLTVPASAPGTYWVRLTSAGMTVDSTAARITVTGPPALSPLPSFQAVPMGGTTTFSVTAAGAAPLTYQWTKNGVAIVGATAASYSIANTPATAAGSYRVTVTNPLGTVTSNAVTLTVTPGAWLSNLSVRSTLAASQVLTVGFVLSTGEKPVLLRAAGPALAAFGLAGAMADPRLDLYQGSAKITSNDNWTSDLGATFSSLGAFAFPAGSKDAALLRSLTGACSVQATGTAAGTVLVEAYDAGSGSAVRLVNVSARNRVGTGTDVLIAGFNVAGTGMLRVLVRAIGPTLASFGVTGALADPKLELYDAGGTKLDENDNWLSSLATTFSSVSAFALPGGSKDAALVATLTAGKSYTVQVSGIGGATGDGLVEIYELP